MAKKDKKIEQIIENISHTSLDDVMSECYSVYAKYVITDRAIPDVRDGLKPVQRRIIYSMYQNNNLFEKPTKKCARIVGDVMGKYHPHGDSSIYSALARMSQDWKINMALIDFQGNNGSCDGDSPAAYRYTEARLTKLAEEMIKDIDKDTIDTVLNFDDTEEEPVVLPGKLPNLLLNGTEGIAVAMATKIPPHNLKELCEASIYRINHNDCSIDEILEIIKGPDFPTGGTIIDSKDLKNIYINGTGRIEIISKYHIEDKKNLYQIIIDELPYESNKKAIVYAIDKIRASKEVDGILEVRDETEMVGIRIVIDVRKDCNPEVILQYLINKSILRSYYSANMTAICNNRPKLLNIIDYLDAYINHRREVIKRRSEFELDKSNKRLHIVEGLLKAKTIINEVVELIKKSDNKQHAKIRLQDTYGFSEPQAESIVMLQLYRLSHFDITKFEEEKESLEKYIDSLEIILNNPKKLDNVIIGDLKYLISNYSVKRKSIITSEVLNKEISKRDLIAVEDVMVSVTRDGYIKRSSIKSFKSSLSQVPGIKEKDSLILAANASTIDYLLLFTNRGNYLFVPVHEIVEAKWSAEGKHINYLITLPFEEFIIKALVVKEFLHDIFVCSLTKNGQIKKTRLDAFEATRYSKPIQMMKMTKNDELVDICITSGDSNILVCSTDGKISYFDEKELSPLGLKTAGVKSIKNIKQAKAKSLLVFYKDERTKLLFITDKGHLRIFDNSNLELTNRLGRLQTIYNSFKSDQHILIKTIKLDKKSESLNLIALLNDASLFDIKIDEFYVTPQASYAKSNIELPKGKLLECIYENSYEVASNEYKTFVVKEDELKDELISKENDEDYKQMSIFEDDE